MTSSPTILTVDIRNALPPLYAGMKEHHVSFANHCTVGAFLIGFCEQTHSSSLEQCVLCYYGDALHPSERMSYCDAFGVIIAGRTPRSHATDYPAFTVARNCMCSDVRCVQCHPQRVTTPSTTSS